MHSSIAQLRELHRPAILMLADERGGSHQVVLTGIGAEVATLQIDTRSVRIGITELARYWYGDCVLLWRPATLPVSELRPGMRGVAVRGLRTQLLQASGAAPGSVHDANFDAELTRLVEDFQRAHHLAVDGIAGVETQLLLDAVLAAPGTPTLQSPGASVAAAPLAATG
jgi:general secretion pathway protein A